MLSAVAADPRIQAELDRWQRLEAGYAEELRAFMSRYRREQGV